MACLETDRLKDEKSISLIKVNQKAEHRKSSLMGSLYACRFAKLFFIYLYFTRITKKIILNIRGKIILSKTEPLLECFCSVFRQTVLGRKKFSFVADQTNLNHTAISVIIRTLSSLQVSSSTYDKLRIQCPTQTDFET